MKPTDSTSENDAKPNSLSIHKQQNSNIQQDSMMYGRVTIVINKGTHHFDLLRIRSFSYSRGVLTFYTIGIGERDLMGKLGKALFDELSKWYEVGKDKTK